MPRESILQFLLSFLQHSLQLPHNFSCQNITNIIHWPSKFLIFLLIFCNLSENGLQEFHLGLSICCMELTNMKARYSFPLVFTCKIQINPFYFTENFYKLGAIASMSCSVTTCQPVICNIYHCYMLCYQFNCNLINCYQLVCDQYFV